MDERVIIDIDEGLSRVRGNKVLFKRLLGMFLQSTEFQTFEDAIAQSDWNKAADAAHAIKGITGNLSLTALFNESAKLMTDLRQGPPQDGAIDAYRALLNDTIAKVQEVCDTM